VGVLLQAAYRRANGETVPAPADGDKSVPWWWDHLASQANALRLCGFSAVLLPPVLKTSAGASPGADGYGPFDDYDIGNKSQFFSVPTRFGSREQLQRCVAIMRANGLDVYLDVVPHQRNGGQNFEYRYLGANGTPNTGRFPKHKDCFFPNVPRDPIAGPVADDFGFGDELAPLNARPPGYVLHGLIDAGDWVTRALGVQGYRIDDVKGLAVEFVKRWLNSKAMAGKFAVGEYFDGNPATLNWWCWQSGLMGRSSVFDFSLRFILAAMCNNASRWDMSQLDHAGLAGISPANAVTFVDNPDTDRSFPVIWNKLLGYAYILTSEGYPCVLYKDYSSDAGCYGLKPALDTLIWIHENLAFGGTVVRYREFQSIVYERDGYPNLLVGLHNDMYSGWRTLTVQTGFGPNVQLHDYSGHAGDVWTDGSGRVTIGIPPNDNGAGYVAYSRTGYGRPFAAAPYRVTQEFEGAFDLDIGPVVSGQAVQVGRIWCAANSPIEVTFVATPANWGAGAQVKVEILDPRGSVISAHWWAGATTHSRPLRFGARAEGWYTAQVTGSRLPGQRGIPFNLVLTYQSTQTLGGG
jgi:alpha-amylase